ncbi:MAG: S-methyl-5'-thioadenosine phosphorylase [Acidobacteria bacterium]|nr:S-methyl-5'-thioadenosine phosphorylase [Acidobacteriota bacterium]
MTEIEFGIIGGSGLYELAGVEDVQDVQVETPFGEPSAPYRVGRLGDRRVAFLPRHGVDHTLSPTRINYRANIFGFKKLGVQRLLSASAVGSMREGIAPRDIVLPDQFIDRTRHRPDTFFSDGVVAHVSMADPFCPQLSETAVAAAANVPVRLHRGGVYLCMEGPQFSTRAESVLYRSWDVAVIGMTNLQEARLAREAELCYLTLALVTDYDCWRQDQAVDVQEILENLQHNAVHAAMILKGVVSALPPERTCSCGEALVHAILTAPSAIPSATREKLAPILAHRLPGA